MDISSSIGFLISILSVLTGHLIEGGSISTLFQPTAFLIVLVGTVGAVITQCGKDIFVEGIVAGKNSFTYKRHNLYELSDKIKIWNAIAKGKSKMFLQHHVDEEAHPVYIKALRLLSDNVPIEKIDSIFNNDIYQFESHHYRYVKVWDSAGGYAPTLGILGAVLGLVHVMENLSDPAALGSGIAVAFVATIYGVGLANLLFIPVANRLKMVIQDEVAFREMVLDGVKAIYHGEHAMIIEERFNSYLDS